MIQHVLSYRVLLQDMCWTCCRIALVRCIVEMASRLHASKQSLGQRPSAPDMQRRAAEELDEDLLQVCCTLYTEQLAGTGHPLDAATIARALPDIDPASLMFQCATQAAQLCALITVTKTRHE